MIQKTFYQWNQIIPVFQLIYLSSDLQFRKSVVAKSCTTIKSLNILDALDNIDSDVDLSDIGVCSDSDQYYSKASSDDEYLGAVSIICGDTHITPGDTSPLNTVPQPFAPAPTTQKNEPKKCGIFHYTA